MKVALSFDDGPSEWTGPILDLLAARDAHATFFVIGNHAVGHHGLLERMLADGHEIGNHTTTHPRLSTCGEQQIRDELGATQVILEGILGKFPTFWRAPHFDMPDLARNIALEFGLSHIGCDIDPGDWANDSPASIADHVSRRLRHGDVVDLHDGIPARNSGTPTRAATVQAVRLLLDEMPDVEFVTVSEL